MTGGCFLRVCSGELFNFVEQSRRTGAHIPYCQSVKRSQSGYGVDKARD